MAEKEKKEKTLEQNMDELEKLIGRLENDDMPLDKAFETYKKGITLLAECNKSVERVEKELKILESEGI